MTARCLSAFSLSLCLALGACSDQAKPVQGFVLPPGDIEAGQQVFIAYRCFSCHSIPDVELPERNVEPPFEIVLGGKILRVNNYGELLTSVVYPDHVLSPKYQSQLKAAGKEANMTTMPYFGDTMTVTELINLVEFLNAQYTRLQPEVYRDHYPAVL